jgi:hypothetical protein
VSISLGRQASRQLDLSSALAGGGGEGAEAAQWQVGGEGHIASYTPEQCSLGAAATGLIDSALPTAVATRSRLRWRQRWWRRLSAVAAVSAGVCIEQVIVSNCAPASWLITTRAFGTPTRQQSYSTVKSAAETAGGGLEQVGSPPRGASFTMRDLVWQRGGIEKSAGTQPARLTHLQPQGWGRQDGGGPRGLTTRLHRYHFPQQGGAEVAGRWSG